MKVSDLNDRSKRYVKVFTDGAKWQWKLYTGKQLLKSSGYDFESEAVAQTAGDEALKNYEYKDPDVLGHQARGLSKAFSEADKLTFKQYLNSKEQLREAVKQVPVHKAEYLMRKYCKLPVGESKEDKQYIPLKPKHKIIVEWEYQNAKNPRLLSIYFENVDGINSDDEFSSFWPDDRFKKWLTRNTREL